MCFRGNVQFSCGDWGEEITTPCLPEMARPGYCTDHQEAQSVRQVQWRCPACVFRGKREKSEGAQDPVQLTQAHVNSTVTAARTRSSTWGLVQPPAMDAAWAESGEDGAGTGAVTGKSLAQASRGKVSEEAHAGYGNCRPSRSKERTPPAAAEDTKSAEGSRAQAPEDSISNKSPSNKVLGSEVGHMAPDQLGGSTRPQLGTARSLGEPSPLLAPAAPLLMSREKTELAQPARDAERRRSSRARHVSA
ncbi:hypothetical protein NKR23_g1427 [Pleurostoma richardsiae]|uniref:Uncharacterized protein n=1 Tax=Pleurostoma richardsiae TaxID=41990 RepID=A0AA38SB86_9PEZI|nr:hypothetical protein NKR23_g1427 [Pleurostoma richardsiae]